jgi:hypothetical protein
MNRALRCLLLVAAALLGLGGRAFAQDLPEYRLKAAFLYNFALFTEWPADTGTTLNLCIVGTDPFGDEISGLQGKTVGRRSLAVLRKAAGQSVSGCHVLFVSASALAGLPRLLDQIKSQPVLTVADSPGAAQQGVALNMEVANSRVTFEANLRAARAAGLALSSKLLRLATEVHQ